MSARDHALAELDTKRLPGWPPHALMKHRSRAHPADPRDYALAEQIIVGVIKNHLFLRHLIRHYSQRTLKSVDPQVQKILSIGLYQLQFLQRIPPSAAVNEAVEQAKRFGLGRAAAFVNAILRKASAEPAPPLPDPAASPADYAEVFLSHPRDLFDRFARLLGMAKALRLCQHNNSEPPTIVRLFPGAAPEQLQVPGVTVRSHCQPGLFVIDGAKASILTDLAERGIAQVQDPTSASVVPRLSVEPGQRILDRCAGLGTKTLQIQQLAGSAGQLVAMDPAVQRTTALRGIVQRRGLSNVAVYAAGMLDELPSDQSEPFDRILIDAPCSNSGVLARRPEARYHQDARSLAGLTKLQDRILDDAASRLHPGGLMGYSTCSIWDEENQQRMAHFLQHHADYELLSVSTTLPSLSDDPARYHDGGYVAVLRRR